MEKQSPWNEEAISVHYNEGFTENRHYAVYIILCHVTVRGTGIQDTTIGHTQYKGLAPISLAKLQYYQPSHCEIHYICDCEGPSQGYSTSAWGYLYSCP